MQKYTVKKCCKIKSTYFQSVNQLLQKMCK